MNKKLMTALLAATLLTATAALPASAHGRAEVTKGHIATFADGGALGYNVSGHALMVRTGHKALVIVTVRGLKPGLMYGSHVHNQACADGSAGGHYSFGMAVPGGDADGSEIWPGPFTARRNGGAFGSTTVGAVAGPNAVSVVIHAPSGQKIACADLS